MESRRCIIADDGEVLGRLMDARVSNGASVPTPEFGELGRAALETADPPAAAFAFLAFFSDGRDRIEYAHAGLARRPPTPGVRAMLCSQLGAGRASTGSRGTLEAMQDWLSASNESGISLLTAYPEGAFAEMLARWDRDAAV